jgi:hypothetical protein
MEEIDVLTVSQFKRLIPKTEKGTSGNAQVGGYERRIGTEIADQELHRSHHSHALLAFGGVAVPRVAAKACKLLVVCEIRNCVRVLVYQLALSFQVPWVPYVVRVKKSDKVALCLPAQSIPSTPGTGVALREDFDARPVAVCNFKGPVYAPIVEDQDLIRLNRLQLYAGMMTLIFMLDFLS